jgi:hypothetical protein
MITLNNEERDIRKELIRCAKNPDTITYAKLANWVNLTYLCHYGPDEQRFHNMLGNVSTYEHQSKPPRPLLSVIVVTAAESRPGPGFFVLTKRLGKQKKGVDDETFFAEETTELFDYWKNHDDPDR